jgi:hypothetical protein
MELSFRAENLAAERDLTRPGKCNLKSKSISAARRLINRVLSDPFSLLMLPRPTVATVLVIAGLLGCSLLPVTSTASRQGLPQSEPRGPVIPRVFKVDVHRGWVMYVFPDRQGQLVDVEFVRPGEGEFRVSKGVDYLVGSENGVGITGPWSDSYAKVKPGAISAHFGPLGSIDLHFVPTAGLSRYRPNCGGAPVTFFRGFFEGSVRFSGGNGFPSVEAVKAQATPRLELQSKCTGGWVATGPATLPGAELIADSVQPATANFEAFKENPTARSSIAASVNESDHVISVSRFVSVLAPATAFQYSPSLKKAEVRPPAPFSGSGFYNADRARRHRWSGSLAVDLPGRADVNLTHPPLKGFINPARWVPPRPTKFELGRPQPFGSASLAQLSPERP